MCHRSAGWGEALGVLCITAASDFDVALKLTAAGSKACNRKAGVPPSPAEVSDRRRGKLPEDRAGT
jgi:hypothetical protein